MELDRRVLYGVPDGGGDRRDRAHARIRRGAAVGLRLPAPDRTAMPGLRADALLGAHRARSPRATRRSVTRSVRRPSWSRCCWCCAVRGPCRWAACPTPTAGADRTGGRVAELGARAHGQGRALGHGTAAAWAGGGGDAADVDPHSNPRSRPRIPRTSRPVPAVRPTRRPAAPARTSLTCAHRAPASTPFRLPRDNPDVETEI